MSAVIAKVLMVDNNRVDCDLVAALLEERYTVLCAPDAERGYELFLAERPDCVLLDHQLPGTAGLDALARFVRAGAVVVMLTGSGSDAIAAEALKRGARDYVLKGGLNRNMLERIISRELERRRLEVDLHAAQADLRVAQRLEAIGQLAAGIAHEINTPAQYVADNITFLGARFAALLPLLSGLKNELETERHDTAADLGRLRQLAETADLEYLLAEIPAAIEEAVSGMGHIKKIVAAMKETTHPSDVKQATDLNHVVESAVTIARNEWKYVAEIELDLAEDLPTVECFPSQINQVVLNLVVNAAHAIGSVHNAGGATGAIRINTRRNGEHAIIEVQDSGCGIRQDMLEKIFDPFFTTKEPGKGTGQGLAIVHRIVVEHHRGAIRVASAVGKGSRFTVRLPIEAANG